jgi:glutamate synthase domain-containing protein 3
MAATIYTSSAASSLEYGIVNETGMILTNYSRNVQSVKTEVRDAENDVVAVAYSGLTAAITLDGYINGSTTFDVANILTLANDSSGYGLSGGTIIVDSVNESTAQGDFKRVSVSATQYASTMTELS